MAAKRNGTTGRAKRPVGTPKTVRHRRMECSAGCGYAVYAARSFIARGLPLCPCGGVLTPDDPDDAALVMSPGELAQHPAIVAYREALRSVFHGQAPHWHKRGSDSLRHPDELVADRLEADRRERARDRRLDALREWRESVGQCKPANDEIPF